MLAGCTTFSSGQSNRNFGAFLESKGYYSVPLERLTSGHYLLRTTVDSISILLILDSGASGTLIFDSERAQRASLRYIDSVDVASGLGATGMKIQHAKAYNIGIGDLLIDSMSVSVLDLSHVTSAFSRGGIADIDGVLGAEFLKDKKGIVDYNTDALFLLSDGKK